MSVMLRLRRFARATGGLAAVEFALIAPMMVFLLFGSVELIDALGANRRAQNAAASLADVIARDTAVSDQELEGLWAALDVLMYPDIGNTMEVCITSVSIDSNGNPVKVWDEAHNGSCSGNVATGLPAAMRAPGTSVIVAETSYNYTPPLRFLFPDGFDMEHRVYRRSRLVDPIPRAG